jgi:hypothetical protein
VYTQKDEDTPDLDTDQGLMRTEPTLNINTISPEFTGRVQGCSHPGWTDSKCRLTDFHMPEPSNPCHSPHDPLKKVLRVKVIPQAGRQTSNWPQERWNSANSNGNTPTVRTLKIKGRTVIYIYVCVIRIKSHNMKWTCWYTNSSSQTF